MIGGFLVVLTAAGRIALTAAKQVPQGAKILSRHATRAAANKNLKQVSEAGKLLKQMKQLKQSKVATGKNVDANVLSKMLKQLPKKAVEAGQKVKKAAERKLTPKDVPQHKVEYSTTGAKGKTPAVYKGKDIGITPISRFQKGVQNDLLNAQAAGVGTGRLNMIIKGVIPTVAAGTAATTGVYKLSQAQNKKLKEELKKETRQANAPTKREYMKAVKAQSPSESKAAEKAYEDFMAGKKQSLKFNYGGMIKNTKNRRKK